MGLARYSSINKETLELVAIGMEVGVLHQDSFSQEDSYYIYVEKGIFLQGFE